MTLILSEGKSFETRGEQVKIHKAFSVYLKIPLHSFCSILRDGSTIIFSFQETKFSSSELTSKIRVIKYPTGV